MLASAPAFVFVCETWLDGTVTDSLIDPTGCYAVFRQDRTCKVGGGVMILANKSYMAYQVAIPIQFARVEVECCDILCEGTTVRIIVVYRPPELNAIGRDYMKLMLECLQYLCNNDKTVILIGDLNLPHIDWIKKSAPEDSIHSVFLEFCNDRGMDQYVCEPTRNDHILDIILSNDPLIVNSADVKEPFSTSDHCSVYF